MLGQSSDVGNHSCVQMNQVTEILSLHFPDFSPLLLMFIEIDRKEIDVIGNQKLEEIDRVIEIRWIEN